MKVALILTFIPLCLLSLGIELSTLKPCKQLKEQKEVRNEDTKFKNMFQGISKTLSKFASFVRKKPAATFSYRKFFNVYIYNVRSTVQPSLESNSYIDKDASTTEKVNRIGSKDSNATRLDASKKEIKHTSSSQNKTTQKLTTSEITDNGQIYVPADFLHNERIQKPISANDLEMIYGTSFYTTFVNDQFFYEPLDGKTRIIAEDMYRSFPKLENINDNCYVNSLLQALVVFEKFIITVKDFRDGELQIYTKFQSWLNYFIATGENAEFMIEVTNVYLENDVDATGGNKDCCDFFVFICRIFDDEKNLGSPMMYIDDLVAKNLQAVPRLFLFSYYKKLDKCTGCKIENESNSNNHMIYLTVDLLGSVQESINKQLNSAQFCDLCRAEVETKECEIINYPEIFIVKLDRYKVERASGETSNDAMTFDEKPIQINLKIVLPKTQNNRSENYVKYTLKSVVMHNGNLVKGHYSAFAERNGYWRFLSDSLPNTHVEIWHQTAMEMFFCQNKNAYMLFYEKEHVE